MCDRRLIQGQMKAPRAREASVGSAPRRVLSFQHSFRRIWLRPAGEEARSVTVRMTYPIDICDICAHFGLSNPALMGE